MLLTIKSSKSSTLEPAPKGVNPLHKLKPRTHGIDKIMMAIIFPITAFFLLHPVKSIAKEIIFSNTAIIVETAAKTINRKNKVPQILPPLIALNTFGSVTKIRLGPSPGSTPYAKHDGKIINPAINATNVSNDVTQIASPVNVRSLPM